MMQIWRINKGGFLAPEGAGQKSTFIIKPFSTREEMLLRERGSRMPWCVRWLGVKKAHPAALVQ